MKLYRVSINSFPDYKHLLQENYLDMLEQYVAPQLEEFQPWIIFQQDGAPPHWGSDVGRFLDATFPNRWIGRYGPTPWPPRSPDATPLTSFYGGMLTHWHTSFLNMAYYFFKHGAPINTNFVPLYFIYAN